VRYKLPTVLYINGWRFFFYSNEGNEPIHIHAKKGEQECKYWIDVEEFSAIEAFSSNMNSSDKRLVKEIIYTNFRLIEIEWNKFQERKR